MSQFIREETGSSGIDWMMLSAGVFALAATVITDVYLGAAVIVS